MGSIDLSKYPFLIPYEKVKDHVWEHIYEGDRQFNLVLEKGIYQIPDDPMESATIFYATIESGKILISKLQWKFVKRMYDIFAKILSNETAETLTEIARSYGINVTPTKINIRTIVNGREEIIFYDFYLPEKEYYEIVRNCDDVDAEHYYKRNDMIYLTKEGLAELIAKKVKRMICKVFTKREEKEKRCCKGIITEEEEDEALEAELESYSRSEYHL